MTAHGIGPNNEAADDKEKAEEPKAPVPPARIGFSDASVIVVQIDLGRMGMAQARGTLLNADDIVKKWYEERAKYEGQNKKKILMPGANAAKDAVVKFFTRG